MRPRLLMQPAPAPASEPRPAPPIRPRFPVRIVAAALAVLVLAGLIVGCSSSNDKSGKEASTTAAVCGDYQALKKSLSNLASVDAVSSGVSGLKSAVSDVGTKLDRLKSSAKQQYATQIDDLSKAVNQLKTTVGNLSSGNIKGSLGTIATQIGAVGTAGKALGKAVTSTCPDADKS